MKDRMSLAFAFALAAIMTCTCTPALAAGGGACPGDGCCYVNNGTPGCDDAACCETVCAADAFCCETSWDSICAAAAVDACFDPICAGDTNGDFNIDVTDLTNVILEWGSMASCGTGADVAPNGVVDVGDLTAVILNWGTCLECGFPFAGSCCESNGTPFCDDAACCETVCAADAFCCDIEWDSICAGEADELCGGLCGVPACGSAGTGSCCEATGTPFCDDAACCEAVCAVDPFCCDIEWDGVCAATAAVSCSGCGGNPACPGEGDCCESNGTPGCDDGACCATVCAADAFCCDTTWDSVCAGMADELCGGLCGVPACGSAGAGNCCEANGTPYCDDAACCEAVCAADAFCCDIEWDGNCASDAAVSCSGCGGNPACPGEGDCCQPNGTPGCDDGACCAAVCAADAFCCDTEWDGFCASDAFELCDGCMTCGSAGAGNCCEANGTPYCDDAACCEAVCAADAFCCDIEWDSACASDAAVSCSGCGGNPACPGEGDCCQPNGTPGCDDGACCAAVCAADPFCCDTQWDGACASDAFELCDGCMTCGASGAGSCCEANGTPYCDDAACCEAVCAVDAFCCDTEWDGVCAATASVSCSGCGGNPACPGEGDCCQPNGTPGCDDGACCAAVCAADAFCCDIEWDSACASDAFELCDGCMTCGASGAGNCCVDNGTPFCDDAACCEAVCAVDPFCCDTEWDGTCAGEADGLCAGCFSACPGEGDCCVNNGTPGCDDAGCCKAVCAADAFCCDNNWDSICAGDAAKICGICSP